MITLSMLENKKLGRPQREIFKRLFPNGMALTKKNWDKAIANKIRTEWWDWFLDPDNHKKYSKNVTKQWKKYYYPAVEEEYNTYVAQENLPLFAIWRKDEELKFRPATKMQQSTLLGYLRKQFKEKEND